MGEKVSIPCGSAAGEPLVSRWSAGGSDCGLGAKSALACQLRWASSHLSGGQLLSLAHFLASSGDFHAPEWPLSRAEVGRPSGELRRVARALSWAHLSSQQQVQTLFGGGSDFEQI